MTHRSFARSLPDYGFIHKTLLRFRIVRKIGSVYSIVPRHSFTTTLPTYKSASYPTTVMETSTALTQSMHHITTTKLTALSRQQQHHEANKQRILDAVNRQSTQADKVKILLDAFEKRDIETPGSISIANIRQFIDQSQMDPSVPSTLLSEWRTTLTQALDIPSRKYEHAALYGRLVMEWLDSDAGSSISDLSSSDRESFEHVGRKEMHDQRREWESIVFARDASSDSKKIDSYLADIFGSTSKAKTMVKEPLGILRDDMKSFKLPRLNIEDVKTCISGILTTDLLSETKRKALVEFQGNSTILQEMADVLNMQVDALKSWSWGEEGIPVEVRRALNGKYRVYMDEEIIQAMLLHFIGMKWAIHFKMVFETFFHSGAWKQDSRNSLNRQARQRRHQFLGSVSENAQNVRNERRDRYRRDYFMSQLPRAFQDNSDKYDNDGGAQEWDVVPDNKIKSPIAIKQSLLHVISAEILLNTTLRQSLTVFQSDFRWFGPSLPHATIVSVLRFLGVTDDWLDFFQRFLSAPLKFVQDGPQAQTRIRQCGVPIQHRLSDAMGEAVLFCLDFAVNKATSSNIYRLHDDLWFWGSSPASVQAWETMQTFAKVMGLTMNQGKTGTVTIAGDQDPLQDEHLLKKLPQGDVRWGFLKLSSAGKWTVDEHQIETHTCELRQQLKACRSILAWVQAWNLYAARFISNNFGEPANCLGRPHLHMVIQALEKIQFGIFATSDLAGGNVMEHLKHKLAVDFGVEDIPDGFFYFPTELGGLDVRNPMVPLCLVRKHSMDDPASIIDEALELDEADYHRAKHNYDDGTSHTRIQHSASRNDEPFMSLDEYTRYREETSTHLYHAYTKSLDAPRKTRIERPSDTAHAIEHIWPGEQEEWVMQMYGGEIVKKYGGLALADKIFLPIGLASMLGREKVRWQE